MSADEREIQCWATNTKSPLHLLQAALPHFKANPDGGQLILTSSTAVRSSSADFSSGEAARTQRADEMLGNGRRWEQHGVLCD